MPTFTVTFRFHRSITLSVEAESEDEVNAVLEEQGDNLDPDSYWKAEVSEDWNQMNPMCAEAVPGNPKADYVIGKTRFGRDFVVKQESEKLKGIE